MARKKRSGKSNTTARSENSPIELQKLLKTAIAITDLTKQLAVINHIVKEGIASGEVTVNNLELSRRLTSEINRVNNLTIQVQEGVVSIRKPGVFNQLWGLVSSPFKRVEGKSHLAQAQRLLRQQQRSLPTAT